MALTNAGLAFITEAVIGTGSPLFNNANAYIGVGDSTTPFSVGQTDLQAATNKTYKPMYAGYPTIATDTLVFQATFGTSDANYAWNEWAVFNAATSGVMLNRKVESLGTKSATQIWVLTVTLTLATP